MALLRANIRRSKTGDAKFVALLLAALLSIGTRADAGDAPSAFTAENLISSLVSPDASVRDSAVRDLINGEYRTLTDAQRLAAILPAIQKPDPDPHSSQGLLIECLPKLLNPESKKAIPTLLRYIANEDISPYLRGRAMFTAVQIARDDPQVIAAMMKAAGPRGNLDSPVLDVAIQELGIAGKSAEPARQMLEKLLSHKEWYFHDAAFKALGKIMVDASPNGEFCDALTDKDVNVRAAAHEQLRQRAATEDANGRPIPPRLGDLAPCRTTLLHILETHPDDFDRRAALATLVAIKPGGNAQMIKALLACMTIGGMSDAGKAITLSEPTDSAAAAVLLESLRQHSAEPRGVVTMTCVRVLPRYGEYARPAVPDLLAGFDRLIATPRHEFATEELGDYLMTLVTIATGDPQVISRILDNIDVDNPLNHPIKPHAPVAPLALAALVKIGVPTDPQLHKRAVSCLVIDLGDPHFAASAAKVLENTDATILAPDADVFVPRLVEIVKVAPSRENEERRVSAGNALRVNAIQILGRFGAAAKSAIPILSELASRPLRPASFDLRDTWDNRMTKEAKKSLDAISKP